MEILLKILLIFSFFFFFFPRYPIHHFYVQMDLPVFFSLSYGQQIARSISNVALSKLVRAYKRTTGHLLNIHASRMTTLWFLNINILSCCNRLNLTFACKCWLLINGELLRDEVPPHTFSNAIFLSFLFF